MKGIREGRGEKKKKHVGAEQITYQEAPRARNG